MIFFKDNAKNTKINSKISSHKFRPFNRSNQCYNLNVTTNEISNYKWITTGKKCYRRKNNCKQESMN